ncbi:hypothetical protein ACFYT3_05770 [Nocardia amikacinitolerans]|uniref:hypothetical protein n=1 Tax=Nocardia amikacinitolerans TaxID=756689 RepID=UPI0020A26EA5|nr:hypothetical protein [Nocardia amikacinitolerans]MCP2288827.1 hypothetical protein [Nocardia amikacinitolerans]
MNRALATLKEWINPDWARHRSVPPFEAGLRPNRRLDEAEPLLPHGEHEPDDVLVRPGGEIVFSSGNTVFALDGGTAVPLAVLGGRAGSLLAAGDDLIVTVEGVGLVRIDDSGAAHDLCTDPLVATGVTDLTRLPDGALLATIGSAVPEHQDWGRALVADDRSGRIVRVDVTDAEIAADGLAWPGGIEIASDTEVFVSLGFDHRIERRRLDALGRPGTPVGSRLPVYPGRIRADGDSWWVAAPYARNRFTELLLDEPELLAEMRTTIRREEWFVPRLRCANPYTDTLQLGQLRVLGVVKPWAPARSYGLAFRLDARGRLTESVHSRADGERHGITGVAAGRNGVVLAAHGFGNLLQAGPENERSLS